METACYTVTVRAAAQGREGAAVCLVLTPSGTVRLCPELGWKELR